MNAPANARFSQFHVVWRGLDFDLTSRANSPFASGLCNVDPNGSSAIDTFAFLENAGCLGAPAAGTWAATEGFGTASFSFFNQQTAPAHNILVGSTAFSTVQGGSLPEVVGSFSIASVPAAVPEPSTLALASGASLLLAAARRVRRP
ncbi:MAG: PEP-CTERM sorting domain-containing protein [Bryobacterales bacterium]|nr:PEP-CTERM sorting domain-containing protein [Bryobacterales bacterium]